MVEHSAPCLQRACAALMSCSYRPYLPAASECVIEASSQHTKRSRTWSLVGGTVSIAGCIILALLLQRPIDDRRQPAQVYTSHRPLHSNGCGVRHKHKGRASGFDVSNHSHLMQWLGYLDLTVQISGRYNHALRRLIRTRMVSGEFEP